MRKSIADWLMEAKGKGPSFTVFSTDNFKVISKGSCDKNNAQNNSNDGIIVTTQETIHLFIHNRFQ